MSRFCNSTVNSIHPYVPGEQLKDKKYIKLNTNENPYYASKIATDKISNSFLQNLNRYSDPENVELNSAIADYYGIKTENVLATNGSDEALAFAFMAYCKNGVCYPEVTYGFYEVLSNLFECDAEVIALNSDFTVNPKSYFNAKKTVVIANPNAQTGIALSDEEIESIIANNKNNIVIIDQAYIDFCDRRNAINLITKYKNLLVINTFSKSRSLAGARVGFAVADVFVIEDLKKVKNSFHPYNVNSISAALATTAIQDNKYFEYSLKAIINTRIRLTDGLTEIGFSVLPSSANFVLAKHNKISGEKLYLKLKENGILVRHFSSPIISDYIRITVGTDGEIEILLKTLKQILE